MLNSVLNAADENLSFLHDNTYVKGIVVLMTLLYASLAAPSLPANIAALFDQMWFKLVFMFLILVSRNWSPSVSIMLAVGFLVSMQVLSRYRVFSMAQNLGEGAVEKVDNAMDDLQNEGFDQTGNTCRQPSDHSDLLPPAENSRQYLTAKLHLDNDDSQGPQGLSGLGVSGYEGQDMATFGNPDSQL